MKDVKIYEIITRRAEEILDKQNKVRNNHTMFLKYQDQFELLMDILEEYRKGV